MDKRSLEWLKQADYDIDTAEYMFAGGKLFYAVFMCHLFVESKKVLEWIKGKFTK